MIRICFVLILTFVVSGCSFAPDYHAPDMQTPDAYKENGDWVPAVPAAEVDSGTWWTIFHDPQLDSLEAEVDPANQNLKIALAQYEQAHAAAEIAHAAYFPTVDGNSDALRERASHTIANSRGINQYNDFTLGADLTYEVDLWGRVRNLVESNEDQAQASEADLAGVRLSLHAELANDYLTLRGDDASIVILEHTIADDLKALNLTKQRYKGGISAEADVDQAETQLDNAKTEASDLRLQRGQMEHAIAVLVGKIPSQFSLPSGPLNALLPRIDPGLPSTLLQRRPDVAGAERRVAAANAEIGVARAAWFPSFSLTGSFGFESAKTSSWLTAPSQFWTLGPSAMGQILDFGALSGLNDEARAAYDENAAAYRQTVLSAYQDVEDDLVAMHHLYDESFTQAAAIKAADKALNQANSLYAAGATTYLDVVVTENQALQAELNGITILTRQLNTTVNLVKATGGGWQSSEIVK